MIFQPMESTKCYNMTVIDDLVAHEHDETVVLDFSYSNYSGATTSHSTVTIVDDDGESS